MTYKIPQSGNIRQPNKGDLFGELSGSLNMDFISNPGRFRFSPRLALAVKDNDTSISNMGLLVGLTNHNDRYWAATGIGSGLATAGTGKILLSDDTDFDSDWDNDAYTNTPTDIHQDFSDMVLWTGTSGGVLAPTPIITTYSGGTNKIKRFKNTTDGWDAAYHTTISYTFEVSGGPKNLCPAFNGNLYVGDDDEVSYITPGGSAVQPSTAGTLNFDKRFRVIWIRSNSRRIWVGLMTFDEGEASRGFVAEWSGNGTAPEYFYDIDDSCPLTCEIVDNVPYVITGKGILKKYVGEGSGFREVGRLPVANTNIEMPGIYDDLTNSRWIHQRGMSKDGSHLLISVNNYVSSGVYVEDMPSGVYTFDTLNPSYGIRHRNSPCAASTDFGQQFVSVAGAILGNKRTEGNYVAGFNYYTDGSTERKGIFYDDVQTNSNKISSFTTVFFPSENVEDTWRHLYYRHNPLSSSDKIIGKKRTRKDSDYPILIDLTWSSTTQFTTTTAGFSNAQVGDEVVVMQGVGASKSSHITAISENGGTYTVTVDETYTSASGTAKAYIWNFKKIASNSTENDVITSLPLEDSTHQIQIKTDVWATSDTEIHDLIISHGAHRKID